MNIKNWIIAFLVFVAGFLGYKAKAEQAAREKEQRQAAEAQRDQLVRANEAQAEAHETGQKETYDAVENARRGDFSNRIGL